MLRLEITRGMLGLESLFPPGVPDGLPRGAGEGVTRIQNDGYVRHQIGGRENDPYGGSQRHKKETTLTATQASKAIPLH